jgi:hypothetical protein
MSRGPVVVDTDVCSGRLIANSLLARRYEPLLTGRAEVISFQTVAELRYGARLSGWGQVRLARLEAAIAEVEVVHTGGEAKTLTNRNLSDSRLTGHRWAIRLLTEDLGTRRLRTLTPDAVETAFTRRATTEPQLGPGGRESGTGLSQQSLIKLRSTLNQALTWPNAATSSPATLHPSSNSPPTPHHPHPAGR